MTRIFALFVVCLALAAGLSAQGIGRGPAKSRNSLKKGANEAAKEAQNNARKANRAQNESEADAKREAAKEAREAREKKDEGAAVGPDVALPEDGDDAIPEPGETTPRAEKDSTIDEVMDMLKLTDKTKREAFKKLVREAWEATEKEDKRYAPVYKKADTDEKKASARKEHQEKLKAIWDKNDEEIAKQKLLTEDQAKQWKKASEELRTKTATDLHYEAKEKEAAKKAEEEKKQPKAAPKGEDDKG